MSEKTVCPHCKCEFYPGHTECLCRQIEEMENEMWDSDFQEWRKEREAALKRAGVHVGMDEPPTWLTVQAAFRAGKEAEAKAAGDLRTETENSPR